MTTIETKRLILSPWQEDDAPALFRYASDPDVGPIAGWNPHKNVAESLEIIRTVFSHAETYAIVLREINEPCGCVGLQLGDQANVPLGFREAELGYWIGKPFWGRGLVPEACQALIRHTFMELGFETLWCTCNDVNAQSKRVMEKCGFQHVRTEEMPVFRQDAEGWTFTGKTRAEYLARLTKRSWEAGQ